MQNKDEIRKRLAAMSPGAQEYTRRFCLFIKMAHLRRWGAARKWAVLCGKLRAYEAAKRLHDKGFNPFGG